VRQVRLAALGRAVGFFDDDERALLLVDDVPDEALPLLDRDEVPLLDFVPGDLPLVDDFPEVDLLPEALLVDRPPDVEAFLPRDDEDELFPPDAEVVFPFDRDLEPPVVPADDLLEVGRLPDGLLLREPEPELLLFDPDVFRPLPDGAERAVTIVSAAAPTAPTAAPDAAPDNISPATSTTFSTIADAVDFRDRDERADDELPRPDLLELVLLAIKYPPKYSFRIRCLVRTT
jgi:hypothetical protein